MNSKELRIKLNAELTDMLYNGYMNAYKTVKFVMDNTNSVNTTNKDITNTALNDLLIEGCKILSCVFDTLANELVITLEDNQTAVDPETTNEYKFRLKDEVKQLTQKEIINYLLSNFNNYITVENENIKCNNEIVLSYEVDTTNNLIIVITKRNIIKIDKAVINENEIYISHSNSIMERTQNITEYNLTKLLQTHKQIVTIAKNKGIKVSYKNKTRKYITDNKEAYTEAVNDYKTIYNNLCSMWKERLETPIYYGYSSDETISNINKKSWELNKYTYRSSVIHQINDIVYRYNQLLEDIQDNETNYISITL